MEINHTIIESLDKSNIFSHLKNLPAQFIEAINLLESYSISSSPKFNKIILLGTGGGSSIASKLAKVVLEKEITTPIFINQGYSVPLWVDSDTLAIAITVSGNTEETISAFEQSLIQGAFGVALTAGGKLKEVAEKLNTEICLIPETDMQARSAIGHLFIGLMKIFETTGLLNRSYKEDFTKMINLLQASSTEFSNLEGNPALKVANNLVGYTPVIYSSDELLEVAAVRWKNQFGENSKVISHYYTFPEMNHDEVVGWDQEEKLQQHFRVIFLRDKNENPRNVKRMDITGELIENRKVKVIEVYCQGDNALSKALYLIYFGDWVSIYLAFLRKIDPTPVDLILEMKKKL